MRYAPLLAITLTLAAVARADVPGLDLLRPEAREGLAAQLGVDSLEALTRYEIDQALDDRRGTLKATLTLTWTNRGATPVAALPLLLHPNTAAGQGADPAASGSLTVLGAETQRGPAVAGLEQVRPALVRLRFAAPVAPGAQVVVQVRYQGRLRQLAQDVNDPFAQAQASLSAGGGPGAPDYGLLGTGDGLSTLASAYPMVAPRRGDGFDEAGGARVGDLVYNEVACFRVRTIANAGLQVVTNLVDGEPVPAGDGLQVVESAGALVRDLVLVAGRDLQQVSRQVGETTVRSWSRARDAQAAAFALEVAADALASYQRRFGPYPWTELDVAEASLTGGAGGVEFCSMVLMAGMLYRDPSTSTNPMALYNKVLGQLNQAFDDAVGGGRKRSGNKQGDEQEERPALLRDQLEFTVAHEVAHQYFACLVGNDSHRDPALDEPLAQYLAGLAWRDRHGEASARQALDANVKLNYALYRALGGLDRPVRRPTSDYASSLEYAALVYGKAPFLYVALEQKVGEERLDAALGSLVRAQRFRIVPLDAWIAGLEQALGPDAHVRGQFARWLEGVSGDADLGVDDSGDLVYDAMFGRGTGAQLRRSLEGLGIDPKDYLRSMLPGLSAGGDAPRGEELDLDQALDVLRKLGGQQR